MSDVQHYDAVVIGSGQGGGPLAVALAQAGKRTAIIEREHVGGTCINEGCTPTKTMIASGRVAYLARRGADYGVRTGPLSIDMPKVRQRKRDIVASFRGGSERRLAAAPGLDLLMGEARFTGFKALTVHLQSGEIRTLSAETFIINTGARPAPLTIEGADAVPVLNSTSIMELAEVPGHLLVLGGGYVGLEFGQLFRRLGSEVTIIQRGPQLLGREDPDVAEAVAQILREDGVTVLLQGDAQRISRGSEGTIVLEVQTSEGKQTLTGSHLLAAAGRVPNTEALNPTASGIQIDKRGNIPVNARLETNVSGVYAIGDVNGGPAFTHISYDDYRILRTNLIEGGAATTTGRLVPYTVFIDPQLGRVGLSETEARQQGLAVRVAKMPMSNVARALEVDEARGFMKAIVAAGSEQILGCAILGLEGGELMAMLEIAMLGKLPYPVLREAIFAHPTLAESFNNLFSSFEN
jgi:pyruvate/2-oxoglutarate dehydrogenase complex dihydrolipoamide dehydrogenase (E3) component